MRIAGWLESWRISPNIYRRSREPLYVIVIQKSTHKLLNQMGSDSQAGKPGGEVLAKAQRWWRQRSSNEKIAVCAGAGVLVR